MYYMLLVNVDWKLAYVQKSLSLLDSAEKMLPVLCEEFGPHDRRDRGDTPILFNGNFLPGF